MPLLDMMEKQHCPLAATQSMGGAHSERAIRPAPAVPSRPSPARAGITPVVPRPRVAVEIPPTPRTPPAMLLVTLLAARRANPPD